jgi:acyl dehydratase
MNGGTEDLAQRDQAVVQDLAADLSSRAVPRHRRIVHPMHRALVLLGMLLAGLLVAVPALAAGAGREVERDSPSA